MHEMKTELCYYPESHSIARVCGFTYPGTLLSACSGPLPASTTARLTHQLPVTSVQLQQLTKQLQCLTVPYMRPGSAQLRDCSTDFTHQIRGNHGRLAGWQNESRELSTRSMSWKGGIPNWAGFVMRTTHAAVAPGRLALRQILDSLIGCSFGMTTTLFELSLRKDKTVQKPIETSYE